MDGSVSGPYSVDDEMTNEYGTVGGMRNIWGNRNIQREKSLHHRRRIRGKGQEDSGPECATPEPYEDVNMAQTLPIRSHAESG
jgi:hypothetical protein